MTTAAFFLVISSAFAHATWNLLHKRSGDKVAFIWCFTAVSFAVCLAPAVVFVTVDGITWKGAGFGAASAVIHGGYGFALSRSYRLGDLSAVYPIARGTGPALIPLAAVLFLGEEVTPVAGLGIALVVIGIYVIQAASLAPAALLQPLRAINRPETRAAFLTGCLIATYSVWDKAALDHLSPMVLNQFTLCGYLVLLAPLVLRSRGAAAREEWRRSSRSVVAAGVLAPLAYVLVLTALTTSQVAYVAPTREVGIVLGAVLGVLLLGEGYGASRVTGAVLIVGGVFALALAP